MKEGWSGDLGGNRAYEDISELMSNFGTFTWAEDQAKQLPVIFALLANNNVYIFYRIYKKHYI